MILKQNFDKEDFVAGRTKGTPVEQPKQPQTITSPADLLFSMASRRRRMGGRNSLPPVAPSSASQQASPTTNQTGVF